MQTFFTHPSKHWVRPNLARSLSKIHGVTASLPKARGANFPKLGQTKFPRPATSFPPRWWQLCTKFPRIPLFNAEISNYTKSKDHQCFIWFGKWMRYPLRSPHFFFDSGRTSLKITVCRPKGPFVCHICSVWEIQTYPRSVGALLGHNFRGELRVHSLQFRATNLRCFNFTNSLITSAPSNLHRQRSDFHFASEFLGSTFTHLEYFSECRNDFEIRKGLVV